MASLVFYTVTYPLPGLYVLLRYKSLGLAWFASTVYLLLCIYLTFVSPPPPSPAPLLPCPTRIQLHALPCSCSEGAGIEMLHRSKHISWLSSCHVTMGAIV